MSIKIQIVLHLKEASSFIWAWLSYAGSFFGVCVMFDIAYDVPITQADLMCLFSLSQKRRCSSQYHTVLHICCEYQYRLWHYQYPGTAAFAVKV